jgi:carbamoyl-phosphate synthase large subunit
MQHIEQAGIHSGDSACSLPPYSLPTEAQNLIREQVKAMALELDVVGLMNVQMAWQDGKMYIIEVNPRASRTVPFVSKAIGHSLAKIGSQVMTGKKLSELGFTRELIPNYFSVKEAVMPFNKFHGVDPVLSPEMKSTGEVMGTGKTFAEAFAKAVIGAGSEMPTSGKVIISVKNKDKVAALAMAKDLDALGFEVVATKGTAAFFSENGLPTQAVNKVKEGRPHLVDMIKNDEVSYVMNTTEGRQSMVDSAEIRRGALQHKVYYTTTLAGAEASVMAMKIKEESGVNRLQDLHAASVL